MKTGISIKLEARARGGCAGIEAQKKEMVWRQPCGASKHAENVGITGARIQSKNYYSQYANLREYVFLCRKREEKHHSLQLCEPIDTVTRWSLRNWDEKVIRTPRPDISEGINEAIH